MGSITMYNNYNIVYTLMAIETRKRRDQGHHNCGHNETSEHREEENRRLFEYQYHHGGDHDETHESEEEEEIRQV